MTSSGPSRLARNSHSPYDSLPTRFQMRTRPSIPPDATNSPSGPGKGGKSQRPVKGLSTGSYGDALKPTQTTESVWPVSLVTIRPVDVSNR